MVLLDREDGGDEREEEEAAAATVAAAALDEEARVNIGLRRGRVFFFFFFLRFDLFASFDLSSTVSRESCCCFLSFYLFSFS